MAQRLNVTKTGPNAGQPRKATPYQYGYAGELHIKKALEEIGFKASRAAASQGPWDVAAVSADYALYVQAKRGGRPSPCDYKTLTEMLVPPGVLKVVVWMPSGLEKARVIYCADSSGAVPMPEVFGRIGWLEGFPPKQAKLRGI